MTDQLSAARADLAFMRELAEDHRPLPAHLGHHIFWPGLLYGLNVIYAWAGLAGYAPWPADWHVWAWAPATAVYVPICIWTNLRDRHQPLGPGARMFAAAFSTVALLTVTIVTSVVIASYAAKTNLAVIWPPMALAIYGGAWLVIGILLKRGWALLVALGCCATTVLMSALIGAPEHWLVMGLGLLAFLALPGAAMIWKKPSA